MLKKAVSWRERFNSEKEKHKLRSPKNNEIKDPLKKWGCNLQIPSFYLLFIIFLVAIFAITLIFSSQIYPTCIPPFTNLEEDCCIDYNKNQICDYHEPTCFDGILNQREEGTDCGGPCNPCPKVCKARKTFAMNPEGFCVEFNTTCVPHRFTLLDKPCPQPNCSDATRNQGETGIDCGGPCEPCISCADERKNQGELGVDCGGPCGQSCNSEQITNDSQSQLYPTLFKPYIVWQDLRHGNPEIYSYNLSSKQEMRITNTSFNNFNPYVSNNSIVWHTSSEYTKPNVYSYWFNDSQRKRLTGYEQSELYPVLWGDHLVFQDSRHRQFDLFMLDLSTGSEKLIAQSARYDGEASIFEDKLVYTSYVNGLDNPDIMLYDITSEATTQLTNRSSRQIEPEIYKDTVVWMDDTAGHWDIFALNLKTGEESRITSNPGDQMYPDIWGEWIVWMDDRRGNWDIYAYNLNTSQLTLVTPEVSDQKHPVIHQDCIVWMSNQNENWDIYALKQCLS